MEEDLKKEENKKVIPHFWNLNEDPALTGMVVHFCKQGNNKLSQPAISNCIRGIHVTFKL